PGLPISLKIDGSICGESETIIMPDIANMLVHQLFTIASRPMENYLQTGDDDFSVSIKGLSRFRICTYRQRGSMAAVIRVVSFDVPTPADFSIPAAVINVAENSHGLILVTGPAGGGKSTTMACITEAINCNRNAHIITIEDPIEYLHKNKKSVISQREIGADTVSYIAALRASLRQAPDVIMLGEMRDLETIKIAMTAAETGHLVISTLHTVGAVNTIDRIIDVFPPNQQQQIRAQLSMVLQTVISQQLVPAIKGGLLPIFEIMHLNSAIRTMIREAKTHQIDSVIQSSAADGMFGMDFYLFQQYKNGLVSKETALLYAMNPGQMERRVQDFT
ncbi:MAG: PilT/PilU family type 4a pilus ATPase, partial [Clostridiales bacterium]